MTIEKLKSGSYRIRQMDKGKLYLVTIDHKPTKAEATRLIAEKLVQKPVSSKNMTLEQACLSYIEERENIISPSTSMGYHSIVKRIPPKYAGLHLMDISNATIQAMTNDYVKGHSVKTTKNYVSFIMSVLNYNDITVKSPSMPQAENKCSYIPSKEDIIAVFQAIKGTDYEIPITLAALGLRRSEICALTLSDLQGNKLSINKAKVPDKDGEWVIKGTKTTASTRTIIIPDYLADMIRKQGYVYVGYPGNIYVNLHRAQKRAGVPRFALHKMRHFFASYMHDQGFSDKQIQEMGGWSGDGFSKTMKTIYQHAMNLEQAKKNMADSIGNLR